MLYAGGLYRYFDIFTVFSFEGNMGKGSELLSLLKTGNSGEARKIIQKLKKQGMRSVCLRRRLD